MTRLYPVSQQDMVFSFDRRHERKYASQENAVVHAMKEKREQDYEAIKRQGGFKLAEIREILELSSTRIGCFLHNRSGRHKYIYIYTFTKFLVQ